MSVLHCPTCLATVVVPLKLSLETKAEVAALAKQSRYLAIDLLRKNSGIRFSATKMTVLHLTEQPGMCNCCEAQLEKAESTFCADCETLNLNWSRKK
jgi:hypothetical protein